MNKLLTLGTVAFDAIETPMGKTDKILGGSGSYASLAASIFGVDIGLVSVVGGDFPNEYTDMFKGKGIDVDGVEMVSGGKTFFWSGKYHKNMDIRDTLETQLNVMENFEPKVPAAYADADILILGNLDPTVQLSVVNQMSHRPKLILLDTMNFWMDTVMDSLLNTIKKVDLMVINDEEARQLSGEYALLKAAKAICAMGPRYVIVKKGEHGALVYGEDRVFCVPAVPLELVYDPTGAGDAFLGGVAGYMACSGDMSFDNLKKAVVHGCNLGSFCVEEFGTKSLQNLTKENYDQRLSAFVDMIHTDTKASMKF